MIWAFLDIICWPPLFNIVLLLFCLLAKGNQEDNRWGTMEGRGLSLRSLMKLGVVSGIALSAKILGLILSGSVH